MKVEASRPAQRPVIRVSAAWVRRVIGLGLSIAGMVVIAARFADTSWCWLLWVALGLVVGAIVGRGTDVWLVALAAVAFYPTAAWLGLPGAGVEPTYWAILNLLGAFLVAAGFVVGTLLWWRPDAERAPAARANRPASPWLVGGAVVLALVGVAGWSGYSGVIGSELMVQPLAKDKWLGCDTPSARFGWSYEAINYDIADDARLLAANPDPQRFCTGRGAPAGTEVLSSDGTPIAGWYIPAANGLGPGGPTLIVAPGWKSNKSEILKYAPAFHDAYNLVLVDLRNGGRSGGDVTTWGYRERDDVRAMVDWLVRTKRPSWIGATGNSMGAATVLAEAVGDPRIRALVLDSMHASVEQSFSDGIPHEKHLPGYPTAWAMTLWASYRIGADITTVDPVRTITQLGNRPVLLIHGRADQLDRPEHSADLNFAAAKAAGVPVELHYCDTGTHGKVIDNCPSAWASWARSFLDPLAATGS